MRQIGELDTEYGHALVMMGNYVKEDGPTAILLEPAICHVSVNIPGESELLPTNEFCVKVWDMSETLRQDLLDSGLFVDTGKRIRTGYAVAEVWRIVESESPAPDEPNNG